MSLMQHVVERPVMVRVHTIDIEPPLANASCAWASDLTQLRELYDCPYTGAVTTRTATLKGFGEDASNTVSSPSCSCNGRGATPFAGGIFEVVGLYAQLLRLLAPSTEVVHLLGLHNSYRALPLGEAYQTDHHQHHRVRWGHPPTNGGYCSRVAGTSQDCQLTV